MYNIHFRTYSQSDILIFMVDLINMVAPSKASNSSLESPRSPFVKHGTSAKSSWLCEGQCFIIFIHFLCVIERFSLSVLKPCNVDHLVHKLVYCVESLEKQIFEFTLGSYRLTQQCSYSVFSSSCKCLRKQTKSLLTSTYSS